jgi:hypothetical protein
LQVYIEQYAVMKLIPVVFDTIATHWKNHAPHTHLETWLIALARSQELFEQVQPGLTAEVLVSAWRIVASFSAAWQTADIE